VGVTISSMTRPVMASSMTGAGVYAPMPPVLGPRSSSKVALWSWAAGRGGAEARWVVTEKDAASPVVTSSATTVRPAAPDATSTTTRRRPATPHGATGHEDRAPRDALAR